jgi:hypothetical protein
LKRTNIEYRSGQERRGWELGEERRGLGEEGVRRGGG